MYRLLTIASLICIANARTPRILDGTATSIEQVPYQASLIKSPYGYVCGGSIISEDFVLTAGHCFTSTEPDDYSVRVGSSFVNRDGDVHQVTEIIRHEGFRRKGMLNSPIHDVALVKVAPPINIDGRTKSTIEIYDKFDSIVTGDVGLAAGWGAVLKPASEGLSSVNLTVIDMSKCLDDFKDYDLGETLTNNFCAKHPVKGKNICEGDAGGAFVVDGKQAGMISWSWPWVCVESRFPSVYVDVAKYHDWIAQLVGLPGK